MFSGLPAQLPIYAFGYTGGITSDTHRALLDKGISQPMFLAWLHTVVQHTVWLTRRGKITSLPILPHQAVENRHGAGCTSLARYLDTAMPLNRFRHMSTITVLRRVWPGVSILRSLYTEGILNSYYLAMAGPGSSGRHRDQCVHSSPSRLRTHLVNPVCVDRYLQSPLGLVAYFITNSRSPHRARRVSQFTCLWEVTWEGDETVEHFAFWSPSNAPVSAVSYAAVVHTLFEVIAPALGFRSTRTYRVLSLAMPVAS